MKIDWRLVVAIVALIVAILGFFGGSWWRTSDVVYDKRAVEIPLSDSLRTYIEHALTAVPSDSIAIKKKQEVASSSLDFRVFHRFCPKWDREVDKKKRVEEFKVQELKEEAVS